MSTAYEIAARLARRHANKGMAELSMVETLAVVEAINGGMTELYRHIPVSYREQDMVFSGSPRSAVSCQLVQGATALTVAAFNADEIGRTVVFSGASDGAWHQVAAQGALRLPWLGTTGTYSATIYPDALDGLGAQVERIVNDPILVENTGGRRRLRLLPDTQRRDWMSETPQFGTPEHYFLQPAGFSDGAVSVAWLRLWPIPAVAVRLIARAAWWPSRLRVNDVQGGATALPVPEAGVEDLIDLCGLRLATIPGWQQVPYALASDNAARAVNRLRSWATTLHAPTHRVRTPIGW